MQRERVTAKPVDGARGSKQLLGGPNGNHFHDKHNQGWLQVGVSEPLRVKTPAGAKAD